MGFKPRNSPIKLSFHTNISCSINSSVKVKGNASPYDRNQIYWTLRRKKNPQLSPNTVKLLVNQAGKCSYCNLYFKDYNKMEIDHIIPKSQGRKDVSSTLRLIHRHCHDTVINIQK